MGAWQESILLVALAVVVALLLKTFFVQAFYIPSGSMEPGLQLNDRILVEKPSYWLSGTPQRGDVVVFADPGGWLTAEEAASPQNPVSRGLARIGLYPSGGHLVKRVIGVAGDRITCCDKQGRISVNGHPLDESSYARPATFACGHADRPGACYGPMPGTAHWRAGPVPKGFVFVMGDNRAHSADSTVHLCTADETDCAKSPWVPVHDVVGKVAAVVWPLGHARIEHRPSDFTGVPSP
jgi:signal peptidase I